MIRANLDEAIGAANEASLHADILTAGGTASAGMASKIYSMTHPREAAPVMHHKVVPQGMRLDS